MRSMLRLIFVAALAAATPTAAQQLEIREMRALLHVLLGDFEPAAKLLAAAPGLGSSSGEHPGHLLFPLFGALLGGTGLAQAVTVPESGMDLEELELLTSESDEPRLSRRDRSPLPHDRRTCG